MRHTFRFRRPPPCQASPLHSTCGSAQEPPPLSLPATSPRIQRLSLDGKPPKNYLTSATTQRSHNASASSLFPLRLHSQQHKINQDTVNHRQVSPHTQASRALSYPFPPPPIATEFNSTLSTFCNFVPVDSTQQQLPPVHNSLTLLRQLTPIPPDQVKINSPVNLQRPTSQDVCPGDQPDC